jgi:hypothetical protein
LARSILARRRAATRGDGLAATLGLLVGVGGFVAGVGGGADVMRVTLTAEGYTYEGDTTPVPGVFRVEVGNETHDVANFAVAELAEGAKIEEIEPLALENCLRCCVHRSGVGCFGALDAFTLERLRGRAVGCSHTAIAERLQRGSEGFAARD